MNSKGLVLIVEDQQGLRRIYEDVLSADGYEVIVAEDGEKGWEMVRDKNPHVVLLDLGLPKIDGFEVLKRMRANEGTKAIPVIIFSVMGEEKDIKKAMDMGANDYTVKGFYTPRQILSKIKSLVSQLDTKKNTVSYKIGIKGKEWDASTMKDEMGIAKEYHCAQCDAEIILELFPDYVKDGGHWFLTRLVCVQCGKTY
jgi:DNA-binding response OmpR family regulator